jgi:hypothetical protein
LSAAPDFDTQVLPVLSRAGCNAGACHGAAAGRGGFKLSLFGGDPAADYRAIVHELEGRRVNLARPEQSLLVQKPTWQLDHEGGQRFEEDSEFARLFVDWIRAGAPRGAGPALVALHVDPQQATVEQVPAEVTLRATARLADGSSRAVDKLAVLTPADSAAIEIAGQGRLRVLRPGRHAVVVRFLTHVVAVQITAPHSSPHAPREALISRSEKTTVPRSNWIDDEINATLTALRLTPAPRADDATLLRRATLDLAGRLPTSDRVREYLADEREGKFAAEVNRLLASPGFAEYWTYKYARWLRIQIHPNDEEGTKTFHAWLREQIESGRPLDEWTAEMITAGGDAHHHGPANFHRAAADARGEAEYVTESLLGVRLRCANCHNHPLDQWTQDDYHGLAAIFAGLERGPMVALKAGGEVIHPATGQAAVPRIPGERFLSGEGDHRQMLADWITSKDHRRFAKAQVNRLWQALFGRGLVEPIDDLRDTNPATHPTLLDRLAEDFIEHDCDLRHTLRVLANSAAYQRSSRPLAGAVRDDRYYSHALRRPLAAEVLLDAIGDAVGAPSRFVDLRGEPVPGQPRAISLYAPHLASSVLGPLAQCDRRANCVVDGPAPTLDDLDVQLHWINGPLVNSRLTHADSELARLARTNLSTRKLLDEYYLRTLSRLPSAEEVEFWLPKLRGTSRHKKCQDLAWALLSCREFVTNH